LDPSNVGTGCSLTNEFTETRSISPIYLVRQIRTFQKVKPLDTFPREDYGYPIEQFGSLPGIAQVVFKIYSIWVEFGFVGLWGGFYGWGGLGRLSGTLGGVILVV
jgi:hypothetical protein